MLFKYCISNYFLQYVDLTKELVRIRGNPNYVGTNNDRTPLMEACCSGMLSILLACQMIYMDEDHSLQTNKLIC